MTTDPPSAETAAGSEGRYRLLESIPHMVWMTGPDGSTEYANERCLRHVGLSVEAFRGWGWLGLLHPDDVGRSRARWEATVRDGVPYRAEYRVRGADGTYRWHLSQAAASPEGGWIGTWTDIDDLMRAEERLARDSLFLANVHDAVIVTDLDGLVTYWNDGASRMLGWTAQEMLGRPITSRYPEGMRQQADELMKLIGAGHQWTGEWEDLHKDGSAVWLEGRVSLFSDASGKPAGIMGVSHDITARRRAEGALRMRDRAIQAVTQGILLADGQAPDNPIVYVSPGFERLTGYSASEAIGKNGRFLQGKETDPAAAARLREAIRARQACTVELLNYRKDGSPFWNEVSLSPVEGTVAGQVSHWVGVQTDVTRRRALEDQYRQSQKMEAVGQLAGGVAHDFNNLLTVINGYSELLMGTLQLGDPMRTLVEQIAQAGQRSALLTRQLLAFSRKTVLAPRVLDLNDTVRETESLLRRVIGEDVRLSTVLHPRLGYIKADSGQLEQALLNLAVNARDAMPRGGALRISTGTADRAIEGRPSRYAALSVSDSGMGMTEEVKARIFEPFYTTKGPGKGTGLGLSVVQSILQQCEGLIEVESTVGKGTTFRLLFPVHEHAPKSGKTSTVYGPAPRGSETLLLVEDDECVRALSRHVLNSCGYEILEAGDSEEALRIAERHLQRIDMLVTDVVMPGQGGRQLADRLIGVRPGLRVLYLSGYTDDAVMRHGIMQDQVHFLQKPFTPVVLAHKIREVFAHPKA